MGSVENNRTDVINEEGEFINDENINDNDHDGEGSTTDKDLVMLKLDTELGGISSH